MDNSLFRAMIAELVGTFSLVFVGVAAAAIAGDQGVITPALGHGLILVGLIYTFGHISGAHFNPAVTVGLLVGGKTDAVKAVVYIIAQCVGAIIAGFAAKGLLPIGTGGQTTGSLTSTALVSAGVVEAILTFFLVSTIYQAAVYGRAGNLAGVAIGFTLAGSILAGGTFTGASLNPARTLGPAVANGDFSYLVVYLVGIFAGGIIAGLLHAYVLKPE